MLKQVISAVAVISVLVAFQGCASNAKDDHAMTLRDSAPRQVTILKDDLGPLRKDFNSASDRWRVVALVSPTCSECVFGAEVVQQEVANRYPATQLATFVIWIPMIETDSEKAARASATIFAPERAKQFYDSQKAVGWGYARQTFAGFADQARAALPEGHWLISLFDEHSGTVQAQWDLYMLYAPGVRWEDSNGPPMPTHWIRHFGRRDDGTTSTYWQDTPQSGPCEGNLFKAMRNMTDRAIGGPQVAEQAALTIEVLGFEGCPNTPKTRRNLDRAVASLSLAAHVKYVDQQRLPESDRRRGWPAPTVLVDGRDLFGMAEPTSPAMGCRAYAEGAPNEGEIVNALRSLSRN